MKPLSIAGMLGVLISTVLLALGTGAGSPAQAAAPTKIGPGVQMITQGAQCTANFVFRDGSGRTYVGYAAHCAGKGSSSDTNGCTTPSYRMGTRVTFVTGANLLGEGQVLGHGRLAYSSWTAMKRAHTTGAACLYNDFALVRVDAASLPRVSPTVPQFGGPTGLAGLPAPGTEVYTLGSSSLRGSTQAKSGTVQTRSPWTMSVFTPSPGVPGDSGSGFLDARGRAVGVLSTLALFPDAGSNGVGSLYREVQFARNHGVAGLHLVRGRAAFSPPSGGLLGGLLG
ncbi:MAG TPA: trypsin-like peptidase domain-containing protein [Marmoricola sp.]|nr:trypsin-like peptidase domain-containing protein [Marmoricola sp.]